MSNEHARTGFGAVGKVGLPTEEVAAIATQELLGFHANGAPVDVHLADQLLLPAALAAAPSQYRTTEISTHLITNAWVIEQFGLATVAIDQCAQRVTLHRRYNDKSITAGLCHEKWHGALRHAISHGDLFSIRWRKPRL